MESKRSFQNPEIFAFEKEGNVINALSVMDGCSLYQFSVQTPADFADSSDVIKRVIPPKGSVTGRINPIAYNSSILQSTRALDGEVSCVIFSAMCNCAVVGYTSGALCAFSVSPQSNELGQDHFDVFRFATREVHGTTIKALQLCPLNEAAAEYVISADSAGVLCVWGLASR